MFKRILKWLLRLVDISVEVDGDVLHLVIELGGMTVLDKRIDLIKENTTQVGRVSKRG